MNAITKTSARVTAICPSCENGNICYDYQPSFDDSYYCKERNCRDCGGTNFVTGDLAVAVKIKNAVLALTDALAAGTIAKLGKNGAEMETCARAIKSMMDSCDCMISDDLDDGLLYVLRQERGE